MTHHKDCPKAIAAAGGVSTFPPDCTCPVEPYTVEAALGIAAAGEAAFAQGACIKLSVIPALSATLRAYAAQGKRVEALSDALAHRTDERDYQQARAEKAETELTEAVGLLERWDHSKAPVGNPPAGTPRYMVETRAFLAKQASK